MQLFDYQKEAVAKAVDILKRKSFVYLRMYMRTGKTFTSLTAAYESGYRNILFVTKKNAISSILKDIAALGLDMNVDTINYESLHKVEKEYDCLIIDEAHRLSAFPMPGIATKILRDIISDFSPAVIYLSGTPTPESFSQIFHQFWILGDRNPIPAYNFFSFSNQFVNVTQKEIQLKSDPVTKQRKTKLVNDYTDCDWEKLKPYIDDLFITVSQADAGFKNPVKEKFIMVETPPALSALADFVIKREKYQAKAGWELDCETPVSKQQKLHQIFSGTVKAYIPKDEGEEPEIRYVMLSDFKIHPILKLVQQGMKLAVFYNYIGEGNLLKKHLNWTNDPMEFNSSTDKVYVGQFISSREGVNVSTADALVMFNVPFSSTSYHQVLERLNVRDREKESVVYWIFGKDGIESKIYERVKEKKTYTVSHFRKDYLSRKKANQSTLFT
jgi:hypothetical protein